MESRIYMDTLYFSRPSGKRRRIVWISNLKATYALVGILPISNFFTDHGQTDAYGVCPLTRINAQI